MTDTLRRQACGYFHTNLAHCPICDSPQLELVTEPLVTAPETSPSIVPETSPSIEPETSPKPLRQPLFIIILPVGQHDTLVALRARFGWTQAQLADWFGVSLLTVNRWENDNQTTPELYLGVARYLLSAKNPRAMLAALKPTSTEGQ